MRQNDKKTRPERNKFPETDKRMLQDQAVREETDGDLTGKQDGNTKVWLVQPTCIQTEFPLKGNCVLLCW